MAIRRAVVLLLEGPRAWAYCRKCIADAGNALEIKRIGPAPPSRLGEPSREDLGHGGGTMTFRPPSGPKNPEHPLWCARRDAAAKTERDRQLRHLADLLAEPLPAWAPGVCLRAREVMLVARTVSGTDIGEEALLEERPGYRVFDMFGLSPTLHRCSTLVSGTWFLAPEGQRPRAIGSGTRFEWGDGEVLLTFANESVDQFLAEE